MYGINAGDLWTFFVSMDKCNSFFWGGYSAQGGQHLGAERAVEIMKQTFGLYYLGHNNSAHSPSRNASLLAHLNSPIFFFSHSHIELVMIKVVSGLHQCTIGANTTQQIFSIRWKFE